MSWIRYSRASVDSRNPRALGTCDRCGFVWNHDRLTWQYDWRGPRLQNLRDLVCPDCVDNPQQNGQRTIIIPADPLPIINPRQDPYMFMGQSSSPDSYQSGSPNTIATEDDDPLLSESPDLVTVYLTPSDTSPWRVPSTVVTLFRVQLIGGGAGGSGGSGNFVATNGGSGGGGGGYAIKTFMSVTAGGTVNFSVGAGGAGGAKGTVGVAGGDTWFGGTGFSDADVSAHGGAVDTVSGGGLGGSGIAGDQVYTGGRGGSQGGGGGSTKAAGGGGSAGPSGNGSAGALGGGTPGDGGGAGGGAGGAGGAGGSTPNGIAGTEFDSTHGSGGGGGGGNGNGVAGGIGGNYGGGGGGGNGAAASGNQGLGGAGGDGIIAITYSAVVAPLITEINVTPTPTSSGYTQG